MIEDILDVNGNVIGQIELPDDSTSDQIAAALAIYTYQIPIVPVAQVVANSISAAATFGNQLIFQFAANNVLTGITQAGKTIPVALYLQTLGYYLRSGSLYAAITEIQNLIADTSDAKAALSPFITNAILYNYMNQIQVYLNAPVTPNPGA